MSQHIVVVDDEKDIRQAIRLQLSGTRFEVLEAEGAERAMELLRGNALTVEVIICDVRMPQIGGVEAAAFFSKEYPSIPVIVLTGFPDLNLAVDFMKSGVVDYLVKPVEKEKLIDAVERAIEQRTR